MRSDPNPNDNDEHVFTQGLLTSVGIGIIAAIGYYAGSYLNVANVNPTNLPVDKEYFKNKTIVITGANKGVGFAAATEFATLGGKVVLVCRDHEKAKLAKDRIIASTKNANVSVDLIDMSDFQSICRFARKTKECHVLVNNAGAMLPDNSERGAFKEIDNSMVINYLGPWLLTRLLIPKLVQTSIRDNVEVKIINVGSRSEHTAQLKSRVESVGEDAAMNEYFSGPKPYSSWNAYSNSKLGNMLFSYELHRRINRAIEFGEGAESLLGIPMTKGNSTGPCPRVLVNAVTPGITNTDLPSHILSPWLLYASYPLRAMLMKSAQAGGSEIVFAASVTGISGKYFGEHRIIESSEQSLCPSLGGMLWQRTEKILNSYL